MVFQHEVARFEIVVAPAQTGLAKSSLCVFEVTSPRIIVSPFYHKYMRCGNLRNQFTILEFNGRFDMSNVNVQSLNETVENM